MKNPRYKVGDTVSLKSGAFRNGHGGECKVVSVLPEAYGLVQYRVLYAGENCERRVTEEDLQAVISSARRDELTAASSPQGSWVDIAAIKTRK